MRLLLAVLALLACVGCARRTTSVVEANESFPLPAHYSYLDRMQALGPVHVGDSIYVQKAGAKVLAITDSFVTYRVTVRR